MKNDIIRIGRYRLRTIHVHYFTWFQKPMATRILP